MDSQVFRWRIGVFDNTMMLNLDEILIGGKPERRIESIGLDAEGDLIFVVIRGHIKLPDFILIDGRGFKNNGIYRSDAVVEGKA